MGKFKDSLLNGLGSGISGILTGAVGGLLSNGLSMIGAGRRQRKAIQAQKELTDYTAKVNYEYGEMAAQNAFDRQLAMYERSYQDESPVNKVKQLEDAGLSVGLMYGGSGGMGGAGQASSAPQGSGAGNQQAAAVANILAIEQQKRQNDLLAAQTAKLNSEIELNKSASEKNESEAGKAESEKQTIDESRKYLTENLRNTGAYQAIQNMILRYKAEYGKDSENDVEFTYTNEKGEDIYGLGSVIIKKDSFISQELASEITLAYANAYKGGEEAKMAKAIADVNNEKAKYYWQEILNATMHAKADEARAAAIKLSAEWETGEYTNWKTWLEAGIATVNSIVGAINKTKKPTINQTKYQTVNETKYQTINNNR